MQRHSSEDNYPNLINVFHRCFKHTCITIIFAIVNKIHSYNVIFILCHKYNANCQENQELIKTSTGHH